MVYTILAVLFFTLIGVMFSRYELVRAKRQRQELLRQRVRRCVYRRKRI